MALQKIIEYLTYVLDCDGDLWMNDEQDKAIFKTALENDLLDIREDQTDSDGWYDSDAYIERYVSVSAKGMQLIELSKITL